jgi:hypothetical protein
MMGLFAGPLETISQMMVQQIQHAWNINVKIDKIVVVGGFGDSPALREHLERALVQLLAGEDTSKPQRTNMELVFSQHNTSATSVAAGAVMRAQNREGGPSRKPDLSLGVLRHIPYDEAMYSGEVLRQQLNYADKSKRTYIKDTIEWVIKVGQGTLGAVHTREILSEYEFDLYEDIWIAEEVLFTSQIYTEDFFAKTHKKNRGTSSSLHKTYGTGLETGKVNEFGRIEFDISHLKRLVKPHRPNRADETAGYRVTLRIEIKVIGRNLEFTAYYPPTGDRTEAIRGNHAGFELSSLFRPGAA